MSTAIIDINWARLELLPALPYSISSTSPHTSLGLAFARQTGVHAIGCDIRHDFDAWPGDFAISNAGLTMFSESAHGGEYLLMHISNPDLLADMHASSPRQIFHGDKQVVMLAWQLRSLLLQKDKDSLLLQEKAGLFLQRGLALSSTPATAGSLYAQDKPLHGHVLDYIEDQLDATLNLEELATMANMPLLRFLRSFAHATGTTPHAYITERRLQRARLLIRDSNLSIADIAADCGFAHQSHMGSAFKSRLGLSPQQYRKLSV
ncbi:AraC family transcriptional regulator [Undibacterium pigrum]|uniref:AraC family transcriptional regulator n=1 Tax=Undibacterium pigrum TaxID=401470 RepID=A0A318ISJ9_9BURK|nr:AraC family transcriptional regulator [Undibacterium pigrum]PXX37973.1 AraC family transcriptional regulator [Undibacterium pigrum]